jgi:hypothetical protein
MSKQHCFSVAGFPFSIVSMEGLEIEKMLYSFKNFFIDNLGQEKIFSATVRELKDPLSEISSSYLVEADCNDMGQLKLYQLDSKYILDVRYTDKGVWHRMISSLDFSDIDIFLATDDIYTGSALCSMIRFAYSQAILPYNAISIHASSVIHNRKGYLFLGKSGMGKSTHSRLWIEYIENTELLNDDNPTLVVQKDGTVWVCGTPWSGKTPCYRNISAVVSGIVRLQQANENELTIVKDIDAFMTLLPSCMVIRQDTELCDFLYNTLEKIVCSIVNIGSLLCLPNKDAAELCFKKINK